MVRNSNQNQNENPNPNPNPTPNPNENENENEKRKPIINGLLKVPVCDCDLDWEQARANAFGVVTGACKVFDQRRMSPLRSA